MAVAIAKAYIDAINRMLDYTHDHAARQELLLRREKILDALEIDCQY